MSGTWRLDRLGPDGRRLPTLVAWVAVAALIVAAASCSSGGSGDADDAAPAYEIVVPAGTADRLARGESVDVMPSELRFEVGDTIRIRNEDDVTQAVGPYTVKAGEEFELQYGAPGHFEGMCPLAGDGGYEIVVVE